MAPRGRCVCPLVHTAEVAGVAPSHRVERAGDVGITAGLREELQVLEGRSPCLVGSGLGEERKGALRSGKSCVHEHLRDRSTSCPSRTDEAGSVTFAASARGLRPSRPLDRVLWRPPAEPTVGSRCERLQRGALRAHQGRDADDIDLPLPARLFQCSRRTWFGRAGSIPARRDEPGGWDGGQPGTNWSRSLGTGRVALLTWTGSAAEAIQAVATGSPR